MRLLIAGDYCDNGRVSKHILLGDYAFLFNQIEPIVKNHDFSVVNFEFPIVESEAKEIQKIGPCLRGHIQSIEAIQYAGFNVCTLANNHILDQGDDCCLDTIRLLNEAGIMTVGAGRNIDEASKTLFLNRNKKTLALINCCEHEFSIASNSKAGANPLNVIQQFYKIQEARNRADYIIVIVHGGHEYFQLPSLRMQETYRFFIDAGADVVVNHHQHCYSGYEEYKGKIIFYGLGNFLFDNQEEQLNGWNDSYMVSLELGEQGLTSHQLIPYKQCKENPTIELMKGAELECFQKRLAELNHIISDSSTLYSHYQNWLEQNSDSMLALFEPWQGRYTSALHRRGLLPTTFNKRKQLMLMNYLWCESHSDRLKYVLDKQLK